jgi:hypothetical protein
MPYSLAEGFDALSLTEIATILVDGEHFAYITSLGTYQSERENVMLDGSVFDDGDDTFTWEFEFMRPSEVEHIQTTFLNGARSGQVTAETRDNYGDWVEVNAILTLPKSYTLRGEYYGNVIFTFTSAEAT